MSATMFCPEYRDTDIFRGSYYSKEYSWLRLGVHRCNPNEYIMKNGLRVKKQCASKQEQDKFFGSHILSLLLT